MEAELFFEALRIVLAAALAFYLGRRSREGKIRYLKQKLTDKHLENQAQILEIQKLEGELERVKKPKRIS